MNSCQIKRNEKGRITQVLAENGNISNLYQQIRELPIIKDDEQALDFYLYTKLDTFKKQNKNLVSDNNGEPILVFRHLSQTAKMLNTRGAIHYTDFNEAFNDDKEATGIEFGFLKEGENFREETNNKSEIFAIPEFANLIDKNEKDILKLTNKEKTYYASPDETYFVTLDRADKNISADTYDGFITNLMEIGVPIKKGKAVLPQITPNQTIQLAIQRNNNLPLTQAPNGKPSILYQTYKDLGYSDSEAERLVAQTYTDEFGNWFGRWWEQEATPQQEVSKVVDSNGQPLLLYHGTTKTFNEFDTKKKGERGGLAEKFFSFSSNQEVAKLYGQGYIGKDNPIVYPVFLNIRNLPIYDNKGKYYRELFVNAGYKNIDIFQLQDFHDRGWDGQVKFDKTDGFAVKNTIEKEGADLWKFNYDKNIAEQFDKDNYIGDTYYAKNPNQIKSATENIGTFSTENNDIRYSIIGEGETLDRTEIETVQQIIDQLKLTGLADNVEILSPQQIDQKLQELEYSEDVRKQIVGTLTIQKLSNAQPILANKQLAEKMRITNRTPTEIKQATGWEFDEGQNAWKYELPDYNILNKKLNYNQEYSVSEILENSEGLDELKIVILNQNEFENEVPARYNTEARRIEINERYVQQSTDASLQLEQAGYIPTTLHRAIHHEVQHYNQQIEGWYGGGSLSTVVREGARIAGVTDEQATIGDILSAVRKKLSQPNLDRNTINLLQETENILASETIEERVKKQFYSYQRLTGEREARIVEQRLSMTEQERLNSLFTEQVDKEGVRREDVLYAPKSAIIQNMVEAYHGSPYDFDAFTTSKIGTGEGAQAFGWGLYFADLEGIAKGYAEKLQKVNVIGETNLPTYVINDAKSYFLTSGSQEKAIDVVKRNIDRLEKNIKNDPAYQNRRNEMTLEEEKTILKALQTLKFEKGKNLYKVSLHKGKTPDQYTWLEWDKTLTKKQKESIRQQIKEEYPNNELLQGMAKYELQDSSLVDGRDIYEGLSKLIRFAEKIEDGDKQASLFLLRAGIDGIKYPAESLARGATSDTARGFNYVVFDENAVEIEEKIRFSKQQGIQPINAGFAAINENGQNNIYLNQEALSPTLPIHEFSHLYQLWLKQSKPELYKRGMELVEAELNKSKSDIQEIINYVKTNQPNLEGERLKDEILAELVGRRGFELLQSKKKSGIIEWIKQAFEEIKKMLGLTQYPIEEVMNMTIQEYADAIAVDLLKGENIVGQKAQEYFIRNADRLPLTLAVFNRQEFVNLRGKSINPVTVLNSLNQTGIKQIEKELVKKVIEEHYQGKNKISYDEIEATVRANIMPLERIFTSSYADYGMNNLGDGNYGVANTIILNAPIEHGVTGHFSGDFKASGRKNIKYVPKQLNDNVWVAVEEGYETQANNNNIYQFVGTAGTKEAVDSWINNYNANENLSQDEYNRLRELDSRKNSLTEQEKKEINLLQRRFDNERNGINKGMFGHIRVWKEGQEYYVAELQSDYFQKNNARKNILESREEYKKITKDFQYKNNEISTERDIYLQYGVHLDLLSEIEKNPRVEVKPHRLTLNDGVTKDEEYLWLFVDGEPIFKSGNPTEGYSEEMQRVWILKGRSNLIPLKEKLGEDFADTLQKFYDKKIQFFKDQKNKLEKEYNQQVEDIIKKLPIQEKQFIASQKSWEKRMVREVIKEASLSGATSLYFPTPYTLSVIEGYVSEEGNLPYEIERAVDYNRLTEGDEIYYAGSSYTVIEADSSKDRKSVV